MIGHTLIGNGPEKVIVLHGWFSDYTVFEPMIKFLDTDAFQYAFIDYRGYGKSRDVAGEHTLAEIGADALALAGELGWARFHVLGHSMGGKAALWLAVEAPERVKSVVAVTPVAPGAFPLEGDAKGLFEGAADSPQNRGGIMHFTTGGRHSSAWVRAVTELSMSTTTRDAFAHYLGAWTKTDFAERAQGNQTPIKVLVGENDPAISEAYARQAILPLFPKAELEVLKNAGHYPMVEVPVNLATVAEAFMAQSAGEQAPA